MAGRKRKPGQREANGRLQRPTVDRLNEITRAQALVETATVRAQPHRKGSDKRECVSALGRLWLSLETENRVLLNAGEEYAGLVRRWRAAHGLVSASAPETHAGTGDGPSWKTVRGWLSEIEDADREMMRASFTVMRATKRVVVDDLEPVNRQEHMDALVGLRILAHKFGLLGKDHPFR